MKILNLLLIGLVALLSVAAGIAKVIESPQEVAFLQEFGLSTTLIITYGMIQILGGVLMALSRTRKYGALITIATFALSSVLLFLADNTSFGLVSLLPVALTGLIYWQTSKKPQYSTSKER
ncbi:hypothetical protein [Aliiglaciecola litoralis]|uniref:hypothetical protein n=1 Tax=Aliiglaciecola litoralis TaxID=582857 RepID=UPI0031CE9D5A